MSEPTRFSSASKRGRQGIGSRDCASNHNTVLAKEGVIALRDDPDLIGPIRWLVRRGDLHAVLPGVYAPRLAADAFDTRIRALMAWDPRAGPRYTSPALTALDLCEPLGGDTIDEALRARAFVLGGSLFFIDVAFRRVKLAIEIDGRLYHSGSGVFETDRWRQNLLILDRRCVLRLPPR